MSEQEAYEKVLGQLGIWKENNIYVSVSTIQRFCRVGFNLSARVIDRLVTEDYVTEFIGGKPREILKTK